MRSVVVTGVSTGIGLGATRVLTGRGIRVFGSVRKPADGARLQAEFGDAFVPLTFDVTDEGAARAAAEQVERTLAGEALAGLVNNAGIVAPAARLEAMDAGRWRRLFDVNVIGTLLCCQQAARRMSTRHGGAGGAIVNLSSRAAEFGSGGIYVDYAATKGAVDTLTKGLARELIAEGIRVNGVRPGVIETEIHADSGLDPRTVAATIPIQRLGRPAEIAEAVAWLLSDAASYTVGAILDVAGGR